jgi:hypothetical protein
MRANPAMSRGRTLSPVKAKFEAVGAVVVGGTVGTVVPDPLDPTGVVVVDVVAGTAVVVVVGASVVVVVGATVVVVVGATVVVVVGATVVVVSSAGSA